MVGFRQNAPMYPLHWCIKVENTDCRKGDRPLSSITYPSRQVLRLDTMKRSSLFSASQDFRKPDEKKSKDTIDTIECGICLHAIQVRGKLPKCDHFFCHECIIQWSRVVNTCPLCKVRFNEVVRVEVRPGLGCGIFGARSVGRQRRMRPTANEVIRVEDREQRVDEEEGNDEALANALDLGEDNLEAEEVRWHQAHTIPPMIDYAPPHWCPHHTTARLPLAAAAAHATTTSASSTLLLPQLLTLFLPPPPLWFQGRGIVGVRLGRRLRCGRGLRERVERR